MDEVNGPATGIMTTYSELVDVLDVKYFHVLTAEIKEITEQPKKEQKEEQLLKS